MGMRPGKPIDLKQAILHTYAISEAANQLLLQHVAPRAWRAALPEGSGKKTIASIFAHMHNVRLMWLKMTVRPRRLPAARLWQAGLPARLDRRRCTKRQVARALARSAEAIVKVAETALAREDGRLPHFPPHAVAFLCYLLAHDAHHRGQILLLARQLGYRLPEAARYGIWQWSKLGKQADTGR
jgi:uncharacterized damage-inducible protein DinB